MTNCIFEPDLNLDQWTQSLLKPLAGERYPLSATIELTERCNLSCRHCFINQAAGDAHIKKAELTTDQWKSILNQMADSGTMFLLITGGEPLLRPDFPEIFVHARQLGMIVSLFTNGTLLSPNLVNLLAGFGLPSIEISLYGATPQTYEKITGVKGSYQRCIHGINLAIERGLRLNLKSVILTLNHHELSQMQALSEKLGMKFRYDSTLWPRVDGDLSPLQYQISSQETISLDINDPSRRAGWEDTAEQFQGQRLRNEMVFTCGAAYRSFNINAYGQMIPCTMVRQPAINLLETPFLAAWKKLGKIRDLKRTKGSECETCHINALCIQCPGWSLAIHNDYETPVAFICTQSKERAKFIFSKKDVFTQETTNEKTV